MRRGAVGARAAGKARLKGRALAQLGTGMGMAIMLTAAVALPKAVALARRSERYVGGATNSLEIWRRVSIHYAKLSALTL